MIIIRGGGLAGASAAIAARKQGADVLIVEKSRFPRHKVCGEFLSAEALPVLNSLGVAIPEAAKVRSALLRFSRFEKRFHLPESALGISRYLLDQKLLDKARTDGARVSTEGPDPHIIAHGRQSRGIAGKRIFGFKTHMRGPVSDTIELYFFSGGYVGISPVEDGLTNVCGLMPETYLRSFNFNISAIVQSFRPLTERLDHCESLFDWLTVGPLVFENKIDIATEQYVAGDALAFADPFTGSGILAAFISGSLAGVAASRVEPVDSYLNRCRKILNQQLEIAALIRKALGSNWAEVLSSFIPGRLIYSLTRPRLYR